MGKKQRAKEKARKEAEKSKSFNHRRKKKYKAMSANGEKGAKEKKKPKLNQPHHLNSSKSGSSSLSRRSFYANNKSLYADEFFSESFFTPSTGDPVFRHKQRSPVVDNRDEIYNARSRQKRENKSLEVSVTQDSVSNTSNSQEDQYPQVQKSGLWFKYEDIYFLRDYERNKDGFTKQQVVQLAPQIKEASTFCSLKGTERYVYVSDEEGEFLVFINPLGRVEMPAHYPNGIREPIRTNDLSQIPGAEDNLYNRNESIAF
jgi:hypothetical protein